MDKDCFHLLLPNHFFSPPDTFFSFLVIVLVRSDYIQGSEFIWPVLLYWRHLDGKVMSRSYVDESSLSDRVTVHCYSPSSCLHIHSSDTGMWHLGECNFFPLCWKKNCLKFKYTNSESYQHKICMFLLWKTI